MSDGYIKLWRKALENGWLRNHNLWVFWSYCMLKATYKPRKVIIGFQQIDLAPGQFIFGRKQAAKETGLSERNLRTCIELLRKAENLTIKPTNKFSIITLIKWADYQSEPDEASGKPTNNRPTTDHKQEGKERKEKRKPFSLLLEGYAGDEKNLIESTLQAIAQTRKTGKLSDSIKAQILQRFESFDRQQVFTGCRAYLEKKCHLEGKTEKYLFGIIRNSAAQTEPTTPASSEFERALERFKRNQQTAAGTTP